MNLLLFDLIENFLLIFYSVLITSWREKIHAVLYNKILLNYHLSVLENVFIEYHYENKDKITDIHMEAIGFITDFIHAFRGENYGE
jgi:hypothetical protein